ncbi:hypothetical protein PFAG_03034 [Plasmodium falciparum Santa Lucia]|uniref:Uncharacterized protein n=2 Tax=Plasmodium falciparum TaxID=5833 RepID=W7FUH8_PLAFA|nr:hypothetical protein PFNF135_03187 [Plasmodium falciparum NF135/5.C10]EUT85340.1 hypothetical protein PFAG_03034 [Plasmodium falciparum Santa Lucia]
MRLIYYKYFFQFSVEYVKLYASKDLWEQQKKEKKPSNINGNISPVSELSYVDQDVQDIDLDNL